jgi:hypothetical protein
MRYRSPLLALFSVIPLACSAAGQGQKNAPASGGASSLGSGAGGPIQLAGSGGGLSLDGGGTSGTAASDLPAPWQYYAEGNSFGFKDPSLDDDVRKQFPETEAADGAPSLLYPLSGSMHPMNLGDIVFQWRRGRMTDSLFRIDIDSAEQSFRLYVPCGDAGSAAPDACVYQLPESEWLDLGARFKGSSIEASVVGSVPGATAIAKSPPIELSFSPEPVLGGLYYWSQTEAGIMRATFGSKRAELFIAPSSPSNDYACAGCHSVSRNGKVIAFTTQADRDFPGMGIQVAPISAPDQPYVRPTMGISPSGAGYPRTPGREEPQDQFGQNVALSPDGSIAAINGARFDGQPPGEQWFELRDAMTGLPLQVGPNKPAQWIIGDPLFGPNQLPILPEWSPDGKSIAATLMNRQNGCGWTFFSCISTIATMSVGGMAVGPARPLITHSAGDAMFHFYPSWSPDGKYIAFASAPTGLTDKGSSDNQNAVLRLVPSSGGPHACPGPTCYELTNGTRYDVATAMAGQGQGSTWPKFTPFSQAAGKVMFVSFTSRIDYGVLSKGRAQLWMFAIDTSKLGSGDASFAPIWLPHQELSDQNFTPYWTEILPCEVDTEGGCQGCVGSERCVVDHNNRCECRVTSVVK